MYQRPLQGYETALGHESVKAYVPALHATQNLVNLYMQLERTSGAKEAYSCVLYGMEVVFGSSSKRYQDAAAALEALGINNGH